MDLGAPILDVSVTTSTAGGSASSTPAPAVSIVNMTGGTVTAPGYTPIIISKTITNDLTMAGAAAAVATIQINADYSTAATSNTASTGTYVSRDRAGTNSYDAVTTGGGKFDPNVEVIMKKQSGGPPSKT